MVVVSTTDFSSEVKTSNFESSQEKTTAGSLESLKSTIEGGAQNAIVRSCLDLAKESAGAEKGYWIVYSAGNVPDFYLTRGLLENKILDYTNIFLSSIEGIAINNVNITESGEITNVSVIVDLINFTLGKNDDYFESVFNGTTLFAQQDNQQTSFEHQYTIAPSPPVRFFRLLRIFTEWVNDGVLTQTACNYLPIMLTKSGNYNACPYYITTNETIIRLINESISDLNSRLGNEYVCNYEILCNTSSDIVKKESVGPYTAEACGLIGAAVCSHPLSSYFGYNCDFYYLSYDSCNSTQGCPVPFSLDKNFNITPKALPVELPFSSEQSEWCTSFGEERKLSFTINVTCNDTRYKYFSNEGLSFSALLHVSLIRYSPPLPLVRCEDYYDVKCTIPTCSAAGCSPGDSGDCEPHQCKPTCLICKNGTDGCLCAEPDESEAGIVQGQECQPFGSGSNKDCKGTCQWDANTQHIYCKVDTTKPCSTDEGCKGYCTEDGRCDITEGTKCKTKSGCVGICSKGGCKRPDDLPEYSTCCCNNEWTNCPCTSGSTTTSD